MIRIKEHKVAIQFNDVYFSYGDIEVLRDVSFHIHEGEFVTLVGANGAGKTTVLKLILGLVDPQRGKIEVFGKSPQYASINVGYIPQNINLDSNFPITVEEVVKMGLLNGFYREKPMKSLEDVERALEIADIKDLRKRSYTALSGGQRRRVLVARALVSNPRMLVLDEPTANMDVESERKLFSVLGDLKRKTTILIVTHDTGFVSALTDVVLCIGKSFEKMHNVIRHALEPVKDKPSDLYSGRVARVLHNTELPDNLNCCLR